MLNEYKKHVRAIYTSTLPFVGLLLVCFFIWNLLFNLILMPFIKEYYSLKEIGYSNVVISSNQTDDFSSLKKLDNLVTFRSASKKRLNTNTYIQTDHCIIPGESLGARDIAVSEKMADRLDLKVGSKVEADYAIFDEPIVYTVKIVLPYLSDLYETQENRDFSLAVVGYDDDLFRHVQGHFVYLLTEQTFDEYMSSDNSYSEKYDIQKEVLSLRNGQATWSVVFSLLLILVFILLGLFIHRIITNEVVKYYRDGFGPIVVRKINRFDHVLFFGIPVMLELIWMIYKQISTHSFLPVLSGSLLALVLVTIFLETVGGSKYGKANHI